MEIQWHAETNSDGKKKVSTTACGKRVFCAALEAAGLPIAAVAAEKDWRHNYSGPLVSLSEAMLQSREKAVGAARAGLTAVHAEFVLGDLTLTDAMAAEVPASSRLSSVTVVGTGPPQTIALPLDELDALSSRGSMEVSAVAHCRGIAPSGQLSMPTSLTKTLFVCLGATSEMGPTRDLLRLGASVAAVCRGGARFQKLVEFAKTTNGTLYTPMKPGASEAGVDVLCDAPAIAEWIGSFDHSRVVIGSYIYLDGEAHVRACVACDAIACRVAEIRNVDLAFLASPGTAYPIDEAAVEDSRVRYAAAPMWQKMMDGATRLFGSGYVENARAPVATVEGLPKFITNGLSVVQGPNYALAKTLQNWRSILAHDDKKVVSANMAPPAKTASMTAKNAAVARWLNGIESFEPYATFLPTFVAPVMTALLLFDLQSSPRYENPMEVLWDGAFHGGAPRCAFLGDSIASSAVVASFFS